MSSTSLHPEPSDEDLQAWLATPEGAAATKQVMQDVVAGKHGEMPAGTHRTSPPGAR